MGRTFKVIRQRDSMQCGIDCLAVVCAHYGRDYSLPTLSRYCFATTEGVSMLGISQAANLLGMKTVGAKMPVDKLCEMPRPCILHWNQNHFVVLYKVRRGRTFYVADPGKGRVKYSRDEFERHWTSTHVHGEPQGIALFLEPTPEFLAKSDVAEDEPRSFRFLAGYIVEYRKYFSQIFLGILLGCLLQLIMPFLTQGIVDLGIKHKDVGLIWMILLGELMIVTGRTATDFVRRWLLLHISMRINISLVSDFFIKLLKLPMSFFDTKLMGDLLQRMSDHSRVQSFLTNQVLGVMFTSLGFVVLGIALFIYDKLIFAVFLAGSAVYGLWIALFLGRRKILDYELFEQQAVNHNMTYQFVTTMQEIKLQDCERRRRWEWEDVQTDLFGVQMKSLKLQQTQEAGSIFINEIKNILITVLAATAVINGQITLGAMLAVQYIVGQLSSPVEQLMSFIYSVQDVKISLERINEIRQSRNEEDAGRQRASYDGEMGIRLRDVGFKYDPHALRKTIDWVSFDIPDGKVTTIVGRAAAAKRRW